MHVAVVVLVLVVVLLLLSLLTPSGFLHNRIPRQADTAYIGIFLHKHSGSRSVFSHPI